MPKNQVGQWLYWVETVKAEVDDLKKRYEERPQCFRTQCFNCWSNYWISKDATKKLTEVQELCEDGKFEEVAIQLSPEVQELPVASEVVPKEEADLQKILRYIDDDQYGIIGIWGMGGVGKTRLLHLVHNTYKESSAFDYVLFLTASRECSTEKIQEELREKYGFGRSSSNVAPIISNNLCDRNFLILLDDVWNQINLQSVGIPYPLGLVNNFKRKVVITTRSLAVCGLMEVKKSHKVVGLDTKDALNLFYEKVGDETINSHPLIGSLAEKVVKELDGLPLAVITMGRTMYDKRNPREWEHAIDLLQKSRLNEIEIIPDEEKIYHHLKFSYDKLESNELRDCFLACSLWPEDSSINKTKLVDCWMGLGLLNALDAQNIYNLGYTLIGKLLSACLLEEASSDDVKMHDVIRDMAVWIAHDFGKARDKWIVRQGIGADQVLHEKNRWGHVERATLEMRFNKFPIQSIPREANKLQFLMVRYFNNDGDELVRNIKFFCALTFLDLYNCSLISFPQDISNLVNLRHLNLSCNKISSVPEELKLVKNLRCLFLGKNRIVSFPKGIISELKELMILDLYKIDGVNRRPEYMRWLINEIESLDNIRSLLITLQHATHFRSLMKLRNLPVRFLDLDFINETDTLLIPSSFLENNRIQGNLYQLNLRVESVRRIIIRSDSRNSFCRLKYLEFLAFVGMSMLEEIIWRNLAPKDLFSALHTLEIRACDQLKDVSWILYLPCLQELELSECGNIVQLIEHFDLPSADAEERAKMATLTFPSLKDLGLRYLPKLEIVCDPSILFPSLFCITIQGCPMLKKLPFHPRMANRNLRLIYVESECWEQLEWEDCDHKEALEPLFKSLS